MDKREEIMQSAIRLFSEKGYFSTSVQEIADDCGISKGTLYNFFDSKEALLIHVIEHSNKKILQNALNINLEPSLSPKEKLTKRIVAQFDEFLDNRNFHIMLMKTLLPQNNPRIPWLIKRIRVTMMNWYKDCLLESYGSKVEPYIWDFTLMFQGAFREYAFLAVHESRDIDFRLAARFIVDHFETMINHTTDLDPVLTSSIMADYEAFETELKPESPGEQIHQILEELQAKIKNLSMSTEQRKELTSAIQYLRQEIDEQEPRRFLIKSLLLYLTEIEACAPFVRRIELILEAGIL